MNQQTMAYTVHERVPVEAKADRAADVRLGHKGVITLR